MFLCIHDLVELTGGQLRAAAMPPLAGAWVQISRIVIDVPLVEPGDLFWRLTDAGGDAELAYLRGAVAVVGDGRLIEPWPGTFSLAVEDAVAALDQLVTAIAAGDMRVAPGRFSSLDEATEESSSNPPELKVLQLCGAERVDIYPLTCGQSAKDLSGDRCRRRAA